MGRTAAKAPAHHKGCEGHIACPNCGDCCALTVLWAEGPAPAVAGVRTRARAWRPLRVCCLGCREVFGVMRERRKGRA